MCPCLDYLIATNVNANMPSDIADIARLKIRSHDISIARLIATYSLATDVVLPGCPERVAVPEASSWHASVAPPAWDGQG